MKIFFLTLLYTTLVHSSVHAQKDFPLITVYPGTFKLIDCVVYTHWNCGFTKAETSANFFR